MKVFTLFTGLLCAMGCGTVERAANLSLTKEPNQVMVAATFMEGGVLLAAPRTLMVSGEEATIEISQMAEVPGQVEPVKIGTVLTVLPEIRAGKIAFRGSYSVNRSAGRSDPEVTMIALYLRTLLPLHSYHEFTTVNEHAYEV